MLLTREEMTFDFGPVEHEAHGTFRKDSLCFQRFNSETDTLGERLSPTDAGRALLAGAAGRR